VNDTVKGQVEASLEHEDHEALLHVARSHLGWVMRYLSGRLCSDREEEKWRAIRALGVIVGDTQLVSQQRVVDLLRRFIWALNDESGTVPYGAPEAIGEILAVRPELQGDFLPILCSLLTEADMVQIGLIERGALWALGRIGSPVARCSPEAVAALTVASETHPDCDTRKVAARSLAAVLE